MAINALWNKRNGPGGSARRLHQPYVSRLSGRKFMGAKQDRRAW